MLADTLLARESHGQANPRAAPSATTLFHELSGGAPLPRSPVWVTPKPANQEGAPPSSKSRGSMPFTSTSAVPSQTQTLTVMCRTSVSQGSSPLAGPESVGLKGRVSRT